MSVTWLTTGDVVDGRYELGAVLGVGGMSEVFRAFDRETGDEVAVKVLRLIDPSFQTRVEREAAMLEQLDDPGIVRLRGRGVAHDQPYLVLDVVEGPSLAEVLRRGPLEEVEVNRIGAALASALAHAHRAGIVHRDVKPANVLIAPDGSPKLVDFGIATMADTTSITAVGTVLGTPTYLAPEQVRGERAGPAADVYALGLVLLEAASGQRAFAGTPTESAAARLVGPPALPATISPRLAGILAAMTAVDPADRPAPAHVAAWLAAPAVAAAGDPDRTVVAEPTMVLPLAALRPPRRRPRAGILAGVVIGAVVGLLLLASALGSGQPPADAGTPTTASTTTLAPTTTAPTTTTTTTAPTTTAPPPTKAPKGGNGDHGGGD